MKEDWVKTLGLVVLILGVFFFIVFFIVTIPV